MSEHEEAVRRYWEEIWSRGDVDAISSFYADPYVENDVAQTHEDFRRNVVGTRERFPDFEARIVGVFSCGGRVVSRVSFSGTDRHTGKHFEAPGLDVFRFEDERVVEHWHVADHAELYRGLGVELTLPEG